MESKLFVHLQAKQDARSVSVFIVSMVLLLLSGPILVKGQGPVYLFGDNIKLPCESASLSEDEFFLWTDETDENIPIYSINGPNQTEKEDPAMSNDKYDNFDIDNNYPNNVNLLINLLEVNDAGMYGCGFIRQLGPPEFTIDVEAMPISVSISCARSSSTDCVSPSSPTSDSFSCNCVAFGAYPNSLQFDWSSGATGVMQSLSDNNDRTGTFDYSTNAEIVLTENPGSVTCTLNGYSENWEGVRNAVYNFNPPMCVLESSCSKSGTMVSLTCTCTDAAPAEGLVYSFFRDGEQLSSGDTNVFEAAIEADQDYILGCRGCNGLNYGNSSNATQTVMCQRSTTALPTTTITTVPLSTKEPTSTKATESTTEKSESTTTKKSGGLTTGAKIGISLGAVAVVVVIVVVAVILWKNGEDDSKPSVSSVADGNVTATNVYITSSEPPAPVYGVVKKDSKKKSDKLDDNGAGPRGDPEIPAYGVVDKNRTKDPTPAPRSSMRDSKNPSNPKQDGPLELQYAALDHGNKPPSDEVRKPKEEPTEYATVQSVIV